MCAAKSDKNDRLVVLGTKVTHLDCVREAACKDLGFDIEFVTVDFQSCQIMAARDPSSFDVYEQCFHNLDVVWYWNALQPIDLRRIERWDQVIDLPKTTNDAACGRGAGDAPAKKLYVQENGVLGSNPTGEISMLPTLFNFDSFCFDAEVFGTFDPSEASWGWFLDERAAGQVAIVDESAIGFFDLALALSAKGLMSFQDLGNMTVQEIEGMFGILEKMAATGHFRASWIDAVDAQVLMTEQSVALQSIWTPAMAGIGKTARRYVEANPKEGYRAWFGGASLSSALNPAKTDMAYRYINWLLDGKAGAAMARQGYYSPIPDQVRKHLTTDEWGYWYLGEVAKCDIFNNSHELAAPAGARRSGGRMEDKAERIAVWNSVIDEYNFATRAWNKFIHSIGGKPV